MSSSAYKNSPPRPAQSWWNSRALSLASRWRMRAFCSSDAGLLGWKREVSRPPPKTSRAFSCRQSTRKRRSPSLLQFHAVRTWHQRSTKRRRQRAQGAKRGGTSTWSRRHRRARPSWCPSTWACRAWAIWKFQHGSHALSTPSGRRRQQTAKQPCS